MNNEPNKPSDNTDNPAKAAAEEMLAYLGYGAPTFSGDIKKIITRHYAPTLARLTECEQAMREARDAMNAISVFTTPLERLKNWNDYKEDAVQRRNAALAKLNKLLEAK